MERSQKEKQVSTLQSIFNSMKAGILVDYRGIEANQMVELRKKLNESSSNLKVVKNSLARIAAKESPFSEISEQFTQTRALIYSDNDPVIQAKVLMKQAESITNLKILAGILVSNGKTNILTTQEVETLSKLPSKEELLVKLLFLLKAPANRFVSTLNEVPSSFVRILAAIRDSK
tara:strand:+ start:815 stop:1339 length:525 start_codon:yes stop_codon:yes gene_type:complete